MRIDRLLLVVLPVVVACGGRSGSLAGVQLGARLDPADARVAPGEREDIFVLREPGTFEGQRLDRVEIQVDEAGVVEEIELQAWAEADAIEPLEAWFLRLCKRIGTEHPDSFTPSPLGTPEPGQDWDPVITTTTTCEGRLDGLAITARGQENSASDFRHYNVSIVARRPEPAAADEDDAP